MAPSITTSASPPRRRPHQHHLLKGSRRPVFANIVHLTLMKTGRAKQRECPLRQMNIIVRPTSSMCRNSLTTINLRILYDGCGVDFSNPDCAGYVRINEPALWQAERRSTCKVRHSLPAIYAARVNSNEWVYLRQRRHMVTLRAPPSRRRFWPTMNLACSLHRNAQAAPKSSASP